MLLPRSVRLAVTSILCAVASGCASLDLESGAPITPDAETSYVIYQSVEAPRHANGFELMLRTTKPDFSFDNALGADGVTDDFFAIEVSARSPGFRVAKVVPGRYFNQRGGRAREMIFHSGSVRTVDIPPVAVVFLGDISLSERGMLIAPGAREAAIAYMAGNHAYHGPIADADWDTTQLDCEKNLLRLVKCWTVKDGKPSSGDSTGVTIAQ